MNHRKAAGHFFLSGLVASIILSGCDNTCNDSPEPPKNQVAAAAICYFTTGEIAINGIADEAAWKEAAVIDAFRVPWLKDKARPSRTKTVAKLLWDRDYLYFHAEMDDADLYADVTEHDAATWTNDVFELFFKPSSANPGYYEFEVNAANTLMEMYLPRRNAGHYQRFKSDRDFEWKTAVKLNGSLNKWQDTDHGWSVEGRIPWSDFQPTGGIPAENDVWNFALCRCDISVSHEGAELSTNAPMSSLPYADFHRYEDYAPLKFAGQRLSPPLFRFD